MEPGGRWTSADHRGPGDMLDSVSAQQSDTVPTTTTTTLQHFLWSASGRPALWTWRPIGRQVFVGLDKLLLGCAAVTLRGVMQVLQVTFGLTFKCHTRT